VKKRHSSPENIGIFCNKVDTQHQKFREILGRIVNRDSVPEKHGKDPEWPPSKWTGLDCQRKKKIIVWANPLNVTRNVGKKLFIEIGGLDKGGVFLTFAKEN
jgi:hypothetical protein